MPETQDNPTYHFLITASVISPKDTVDIGDTIIFRSSFDAHLMDNWTGDYVDYSGFKIGGGFGIADVDKLLTTTDSSTIKDFRYVVTYGDVFNDKRMPLYWSSEATMYEESNGKYWLEFGIVPERPGTFLSGFSRPFCSGKNGKNAASFEIGFANTDQHLQYVLDKSPGRSESDLAREYCFVVR